MCYISIFSMIKAGFYNESFLVVLGILFATYILVAINDAIKSDHPER